MSDYHKMSVEELIQEQEKYSEAIDSLRQERALISRVLERKQAHDSMLKKWVGCTDAEKEALTQIVSVQGIASSEGVGTPDAD